ncbi:MAG: hypothetical protein Q8R78_02395, partial [Candidatus Omnitrophota bacterium]|nr:hypothetical protein [Candidatus Omnitrophota bacterium]
RRRQQRLLSFLVTLLDSAPTLSTDTLSTATVRVVMCVGFVVGMSMRTTLSALELVVSSSLLFCIHLIV